MKKICVILVVLFIIGGGNLFPLEVPSLTLIHHTLFMNQFIVDTHAVFNPEELLIDYDTIHFTTPQEFLPKDTLILERLDVNPRNSQNWVVNQYNHMGLLAALLTYATGFGLYVGGGTIASDDSMLDVALILMYIGLPVNTAGCLIADLALRTIHDDYKKRGAKIKENNILLSYVLTGVGAACCIGAFITPMIFDYSSTGYIIGIALGGAGMIVNVLDFYLVKHAWLMEINVGILEAGMK